MGQSKKSGRTSAGSGLLGLTLQWSGRLGDNLHGSLCTSDSHRGSSHFLKITPGQARTQNTWDKAQHQIRVSGSKSTFSKCHSFHVIVVSKLACSDTVVPLLVMSPGQLMREAAPLLSGTTSSAAEGTNPILELHSEGASGASIDTFYLFMKRFESAQKKVIFHPCRRAEMRNIKSIIHWCKGLYWILMFFEEHFAKVRIGHLQFLLFHAVLSPA